jgi:hypothetical protein
MMISLFAAVITFMLYKKISGQGVRNFWICYVLINIFSLYTVPSYVLHFAVLNMLLMVFFIFKKEKEFIYKYLFSNLLVVLGVTLLYLPVILISGPEALFANKWVQPMHFNSLIKLYHVYIAEMIEYNFSILSIVGKAYIPIGIMYCFLLYFIIDKTKDIKSRLWIFVSLSSIVFPLLFIIYARVFPPYRIFGYYVVFLHISMAIVLDYYLIKIKFNYKAVAYVLILIIALYGAFTNYINYDPRTCF